MKKYTQQDFDNFEVIDGIKQCPSGDYTEIKKFGEWCSFGERCSFGKGCSFGEWCSFGERCSFGEGCSFGERCSFGKGCSFGEWCSFGERCSFGEGCSFGVSCSFEGDNAKSGYPFISFVGAGSRQGSKVYFFNLEKGIRVRCGCFVGTINEFRERVKSVNADELYLMLSDIAEKKFNAI